MRLSYVDNLRSAMIVLVVAMHAAVTYSHFGSWYYTAPTEPGMIEKLIFGLFQSHLQAFFMGLLFLLAGYFTPGSYDRKGFWHFVGDRFLRLMVPALIYVFLIHDMMGHFLLHWHHEGFIASYRYYVVHGDFLDGTGPMWFAVALFVFSTLYALVRLALPKCNCVPSLPSARMAVITGALIGLLSFVVRLRFPLGTNWHNMQFGYFSQYVVLFIVGMWAFRGDWLKSFPADSGGKLLKWAVILGPIVWLALIFGGGAFAGAMQAYNGGLTWQSLAISLWEQIFAVCLCAGLIVLFRQRIYTGGSVSRLLADNSFAIYMFHAPVLVSISLLLEPSGLGGVAAFIIAAILTFFVTLALSHYVLRRIPLLKTVL
ncbi:MAG: acyltransferase family protein [Rhizomicrobium sp.]